MEIIQMCRACWEAKQATLLKAEPETQEDQHKKLLTVIDDGHVSHTYGTSVFGGIHFNNIFIRTLLHKKRLFQVMYIYEHICIGFMHNHRCSEFEDTHTLLAISEDLTWTAHIQPLVKKARQRLYHLRQLRKFRVSPAILKTLYSGAIESVLTQCISVWYGKSSNQDCKAMQRVVRLADRISGSALPSLQDIYFKRCKSRAAKIIKDSNHPGNHFFISLPSGKRFRSMMAKTERLRRSFFPQAIRLLNSIS